MCESSEAVDLSPVQAKASTVTTRRPARISEVSDHHPHFDRLLSCSGSALSNPLWYKVT